MEVIAALANGITLGLISAGIFLEAYHRIYAPEIVKSIEMLVFAIIGLVVNLIVAFTLSDHRHAGHEHAGHERDHREHGSHEHEDEALKDDLNTHSAYLHVLGDALSSAGVIAAALVIWKTGWMLADPIASVLIGIVLIIGGLGGS